MGYSILGGIKRLERQQAKLAGHEPDDLWYQLRVAASCPPDKTLNIRSGVVSPSYQWAVFELTDILPDTVADFEDQEATGMSLAFTTADYFLPIVLCYGYDWVAYQGYDDPSLYDSIFDNVVGTEAATAIEAEAQIDGFLNGSEQWYYERLPLCGVVFKNDGNTGISYAIEPIDQVNRGRSYIYRDARVRRGAIP